MKSVQNFLLFFLLFTVNRCARDAFAFIIETTTTEVTTSLQPKGLTSLKDAENLPATTVQDAVLTSQANETVSESKEKENNSSKTVDQSSSPTVEQLSIDPITEASSLKTSARTTETSQPNDEFQSAKSNHPDSTTESAFDYSSTSIKDEHSSTSEVSTPFIIEQEDKTSTTENENGTNSINQMESTNELSHIEGLGRSNIKETEGTVERKQIEADTVTEGTAAEPNTARGSGGLVTTDTTMHATTVVSETNEATELRSWPDNNQASKPATGSAGASNTTISATAATSKTEEIIDQSGRPESAPVSEPVTGSTGASIAAISATTATSQTDNITDLSGRPESAPVSEPVTGIILATTMPVSTLKTVVNQSPTAPDAIVTPELDQTTPGSKITLPTEGTTSTDIAHSSPIAEPIQSPESMPNSETTSPTLNRCNDVGNFSNPTNCRLYITCSGNVTNLSHQENECPERTAFSPILRRCSRDISPCGETEPICLKSGSLPDPTNNSSYYWCVSSSLGGFHKYHIQCTGNEQYTALIGRCMPEGAQLGGVDSFLSDRDIVKSEWKQLKKETKIKAKEEKKRRKIEQKAKAQAEKLASKVHKKPKELSKTDDDDDDDEDDD